VQTVSISYLRCLIEHVRCYILDRDIELVYYTIRKSSDVLTRDPMQLGAQVSSYSIIICMCVYVLWMGLDVRHGTHLSKARWHHECPLKSQNLVEVVAKVQQKAIERKVFKMV
jgi:hypothetical protein